MKNARQLLEEYNAFSFRDPQIAADMFTNDGVFEMPYLESLGVQGRYQGHDEIRGFFGFVRQLFPDLQLVNTKVVCESADGKVVVAEYEFTSRSTKTGRLIHQLIFGRLKAEDGKIKLLRETINLVEVGRATLENALADLTVT
ncbi:MAG TPA: nuclear transport factor 2 family protein [Bryobacteraceae bacterium]